MHYIPRRALFAGAGILLLTTNAMGAYVELIDTSGNEEYHTYAIEIDAPKGASGTVYPYGCVATGRPGTVVKCAERIDPDVNRVISWHGEGNFRSYASGRTEFWGPIKFKIALRVIDNLPHMGWHGLMTELIAYNPIDITLITATYVERKTTTSGIFYTPDTTKSGENGNMRFRVADQITLRSGGTQTLIDDVTGRGTGQVIFDYGTLPPEFTCMGENGSRDHYVLKEGSVVKCTYQGKGVGVAKGDMRVIVGLK